jgi:CAAX protease family protein
VNDDASQPPPPGPPPPGSHPPPVSQPPGPSQPPPPTTPPLSEPVGAPGPAADRVDVLPPASWGPGRAFAGFVFVFIASLVLGVAVVAFDPEIESLAAGVTLQALLAGAMILGAFLFARPRSTSLATPADLGLRRPRRKAIWLSIATYFGYIACAIVVALLLAPEQEDITRELGGDEGVLGAVIAGFLIIVVAPVSEEIFFRGFFFRGLRRGMAAILAALISSGIWALLHYTGPGTWGVVVQLAVFGLWLSWLYERTGSIYPTIAVHAVNNAIAFSILLSS